MTITLKPDASHCIETVAKHEYERVLNLLMKSGHENSQLEERSELLRIFLESADFGRLRSHCDEFLLNGRRVTVTLKSINEAFAYEIEIDEIS